MTVKTERRVIAGDWKRVYLDLPNWELLAPPEGIYDEPTVYYKANLKWAKLIEGFLAHLTEITAWKDAEDENYWGTQQIITFLERVEVPFVFPEESGCNNFLPSAAFVSYYPQNPYNAPDYVPPDYLVPPFFINETFEYPEIMGYKSTDVFVNPSSFTIDPIDLITLNLPRIEITVKGQGQIEVDFLSVELGSFAVCKIGSMPNIGDIIGGGLPEDGVRIVDLNRDTFSIPPEHDFIVAEEFNIEAEPDELTTIYCVFMPKIDDAFIPLAFGGGIRQIGLCAFEDMEEGGQVEAVRFNEENCSFEQRVNGEWAVIEGNEYIATCLGGGMSVEEICEGVICAMEQAASRFLAGVAGNVEAGITINPDGTLTVAPGGLPADDPLTIGYDERAAAVMGGAIAVARAWEQLLDKLDVYYGATNGTPVTSEAVAQYQIRIYFPVDALKMDGAVTLYYAYRTTNPRFLFNTSNAFEQYLFCKGADRQGLGRWLIDASGYAENKITVVNEILIALLDEFFTSYNAKGILVPSTLYREASCTPIQVEEFTLDMSTGNAPSYTTSGVWKDGHRYLVQVSGTYADSDVGNLLGDAMYFRDTTTGINTFSSLTFNFSGTVTAPTAAQVPYSSTHVYSFTVDKADGGGNHAGLISRDNGAMTTPNVSGILTFKITDLGEFGL